MTDNKRWAQAIFDTELEANVAVRDANAHQKMAWVAANRAKTGHSNAAGGQA